MSSTQLLQLWLLTLSFFWCWWTVTSCYWHMQFFSWFAITTWCSWILNHSIFSLLLYLLQCQNFPLLLHLLHLVIFPWVINRLCWCLKRRVMLICSRRHVCSSSNSQNYRTGLSLGIVILTHVFRTKGFLSRSLIERFGEMSWRLVPMCTRMSAFRDEFHAFYQISYVNSTEYWIEERIFAFSPYLYFAFRNFGEIYSRYLHLILFLPYNMFLYKII